MDTINIIDAKINEIEYKIRRESKNVKLTRKQCEQMAKNLSKNGRKKIWKEKKVTTVVVTFFIKKHS